MYIVSNREIDTENEPTFKFGTLPNPKGPAELRVAEAFEKDGDWQVELMTEKRGLNESSKLEDRPSFRLFTKLRENMKTKDRNCVFFVHGYNTNIRSAIESAARIEELYDVEVILFSWPSIGGGEGKKSFGKDLYGTANYKRDKRVAAQSVGALDRCFEYLDRYIRHVEAKDPCDKRFTLVCHSMGNWLLKTLLKSSVYNGETLLFDNVVLCAADVNNDGHELFTDKILHRRRIYITINENDGPLGWSRRKLGGLQKARLGHYTKNLVSQIAVYLDFTDGKHVGDSHSYFMDSTCDRNFNVRSIFRQVFNGERGERDLPGFDPNERIYSIP